MTEGTRKARIGVIGAGFWCTANHLPILLRRDDVELSAVARLGRSELEQLRDNFGFAYITEDYRALLNDVPLDGVIVASPHHLHAEHACAALAKNLPVLVEKPMATSMVDALSIYQAAEAVGQPILVPYGWNFQPYFGKAKEWIAAGRIGTLRHISAQMATPIEDLMSGGSLAEATGELFQPDAATWAQVETGGYGWGQLVHLLGGLAYLTDFEPETVYARLGLSRIGTDLFNALTLTLRGGATAAISGSASLPVGSPFQIDIRLFGTEGVLLLDTERERLVLRRVDGDVEEYPIPAGAGAYSCVTPVERFVDICLGKPVENAGHAMTGLRTVQIVEAMHRSHKSGQPVTIEHRP
ncbi:putative dehydrogenase [Devosia sp. UYZn731]|uniref:Gfo/Idh/MocA family protein n=1 Tax=Devosia sp. UYZn731 TaxID=3156345 RepID=UPI00339B1D8D